jgi:CheY-like chemotaxis protein
VNATGAGAEATRGATVEPGETVETVVAAGVATLAGVARGGAGAGSVHALMSSARAAAVVTEMRATVAKPTKLCHATGIPAARPPCLEVHHILVVDDDPAIRDVVCDILAMFDYRVETASNGAEALDQIRADQPAAVLLDLMMPVMDGWEFLRHCRRESPCVRVPVAVMSAAGDAGVSADELGAQAFLAKPFELDDILRVVQRLAVA